MMFLYLSHKGLIHKKRQKGNMKVMWQNTNRCKKMMTAKCLWLLLPLNCLPGCDGLIRAPTSHTVTIVTIT